MGAIAGKDDLVLKATGGGSGAPELITFWKELRVAGATQAATPVARLSSLWQYEGAPSAGSAPGTTPRVCDRTTVGALAQVDPGGALQKWMTYAGFVAATAMTLLVYDRLLDVSGLSGNVITAQALGAAAITRNTGGVGNEIWVEIYSTLGASSTTVTATYTNQDGVAGKVTPATLIGGTNLREGQRIIRLPLAAGDTGVRSVQSVTNGNTGAAGDFGITIARPLFYVGSVQSAQGAVKSILEHPTEIDAGACLALAGVGASYCFGQLFFVDA